MNSLLVYLSMCLCFACAMGAVNQAKGPGWCFLAAMGVMLSVLGLLDALRPAGRQR